MNGFLKKVAAVVTAVVMSLGTLTVLPEGVLPQVGISASAEEATYNSLNSVQTGTDISVQGTDVFGNMLAAELQSAQDQQVENDGQNIFSVEIDSFLKWQL